MQNAIGKMTLMGHLRRLDVIDEAAAVMAMFPGMEQEVHDLANKMIDLAAEMRAKVNEALSRAE